MAGLVGGSAVLTSLSSINYDIIFENITKIRLGPLLKWTAKNWNTVLYWTKLPLPLLSIYLQSFYDILYFCSWISVGMGFITLLLFVFFFKEVDVSAKERQYAKDCKRARGKWAMKMGCSCFDEYNIYLVTCTLCSMYLLVQLSVELTEIFSRCFFREINAFSGKKYIESCVHEFFLREQKIP